MTLVLASFCLFKFVHFLHVDPCPRGKFHRLFIGWEGVGLCSYLLIGFWNQKNSYGNAARKAFIMNRIGDLGFLIGIFLLIQDFGSTDYATIFSSIQQGDVPDNLGLIAFVYLWEPWVNRHKYLYLLGFQMPWRVPHRFLH